jgi:hypothetical protein
MEEALAGLGIAVSIAVGLVAWHQASGAHREAHAVAARLATIEEDRRAEELTPRIRLRVSGADVDELGVEFVNDGPADCQRIEVHLLSGGAGWRPLQALRFVDG